jgi:hypothetical protein
MPVRSWHPLGTTLEMFSSEEILTAVMIIQARRLDPLRRRYPQWRGCLLGKVISGGKMISNIEMTSAREITTAEMISASEVTSAGDRTSSGWMTSAAS